MNRYLQVGMFLNYVGVTTMKRLDQGHLHPKLEVLRLIRHFLRICIQRFKIVLYCVLYDPKSFFLNFLYLGIKETQNVTGTSNQMK